LDAVHVTALLAFAHVVRLYVIVPLAVVAELKLPAISWKVAAATAAGCGTQHDVTSSTAESRRIG